MGSRLRENPKNLFEVFTEIARPSHQGDDPFVLQRFPDDFEDEDLLKSIPKFAFPCDTDSTAVDHFTFVLTDIDSKFKFGFCRHAADAQTCLCIISYLPWYEIYYKLLNLLAEILNRSEANTAAPLLEALHKHEVPEPLQNVEVVTPDFREKFSFVCPNPHQLPSLPESRNLTEYYNAVDTNNMLIIFASMMHERRILITSKKLSRLTACIHGSAALLYPMYWQHLYIPVLPVHLLDYCSAPMPYLIGIHSALKQRLKVQELGDAVVLDADNNTVTTEFDDLANIPSEVTSALRKRLKSQQSDRMGIGLLGDGVSRAFLKAMVTLIGGYREALRFPPGEQITFDPDAFVHSRPASMQPYLQQLLQLQIFEQFINERLDHLIAGKGFFDEFESEVNMERDKWATQSRYSEWLGSMKKQGKKLKRDGKDKWVEFSSRVRDKSKKAVKDIRSKFDELRKEDDAHGISRHRPTTITSPSYQPQRPPRPPPPDLGTALGPTPPPRQSIIRRTSYEKSDTVQPNDNHRISLTLGSAHFNNQPNNDEGIRSRQYKVLTLDDLSLVPSSPGSSAQRISRRISAEDTDVLSDMTYQRVSLDLMGDPDIQQVFKKSYSLEDLTRAIQEEQEEEEEEETESDEDGQILAGDATEYIKFVDDEEHAVVAKDVAASLKDEMNTKDTNANKIALPPPPTAAVRSKASSPRRSPVAGSAQAVQPPNNSLTNSSAIGVSRSCTAFEDLRRSNAYTLPHTGSAGNVSANSVQNTRPVPAPRLTLQKEAPSSVPQRDSSEKLLIKLDSSDSLSKDVSEEIEFDPLKLTASNRDSLTSKSSSSSESISREIANTGSSTTSSESESRGIPPVPRQRSSIIRKHAFYNSPRPPSFRNRKSPTLNESRSAFIQAEMTKPSTLSEAPHHDDLELFDPLVSGRLAVDDLSSSPRSTSPSGTVSTKAHSKDEDLLKEWNLDFNKIKVSKAGGGTVAPVPMKSRTVSTLVGSSSTMLVGSLPNQHVGFPPGGQPPQPLSWRPQVPQQQSVSMYQRTRSPGVQNLIRQFSVTAPRPLQQSVNFVSPSSERDLTSLPHHPRFQPDGRPQSMYLDGATRPQSMYIESSSQNPFGDLLEPKTATLPNGARPPPPATEPPNQRGGWETFD